MKLDGYKTYLNAAVTLGIAGYLAYRGADVDQVLAVLAAGGLVASATLRHALKKPGAL